MRMRGCPCRVAGPSACGVGSSDRLSALSLNLQVVSACEPPGKDHATGFGAQPVDAERRRGCHRLHWRNVPARILSRPFLSCLAQSGYRARKSAEFVTLSVTCIRLLSPTF
jgi:hypothetical protein